MWILEKETKSIGPAPLADNDYRLEGDSPAIGAGVKLPEDWADPMRSDDKGEPDIGAIPVGAKIFSAGRLESSP